MCSLMAIKGSTMTTINGFLWLVDFLLTPLAHFLLTQAQPMNDQGWTSYNIMSLSKCGSSCCIYTCQTNYILVCGSLIPRLLCGPGMRLHTNKLYAWDMQYMCCIWVIDQLPLLQRYIFWFALNCVVCTFITQTCLSLPVLPSEDLVPSWWRTLPVLCCMWVKCQLLSYEPCDQSVCACMFMLCCISVQGLNFQLAAVLLSIGIYAYIESGKYMYVY